MNERGITWWVGICLLAAMMSLGMSGLTFLTISSVKSWSVEQSRMDNDTATKNLEAAKANLESARLGNESIKILQDIRTKPIGTNMGRVTP